MDKSSELSRRFSFQLLGLLIGCCFALQTACLQGAQEKQQVEEPDLIDEAEEEPSIVLGVEQTDRYLPLIRGKKGALVANHTSLLDGKHLVDSLLSLEIEVLRVFSPEHGFRGTADAGEKVADGQDPTTGLPIISLYGKHKKPTAADMANLEWVIFDIQDVGARFYTYISTLHYVMEACAEHNVSLIVLDRPNPNGFYVDGPVLQSAQKSFVGLHPVPIVHGMTVGEYAKMINGEKWLSDGVQCRLEVVSLKGYDHNSRYELPVKPSPNLPNMRSIYLYPSLCLFEGTGISVGRGTDLPFQQIGHPVFDGMPHQFVPQPNEGASKPKLQGKKCFGLGADALYESHQKNRGQLELSWLIDFYQRFPSKDQFFNNFFNLLAGNKRLQASIKKGLSEQEIRATWEEELAQYLEMRQQYLLYPDFMPISAE